MAEIKTMREYGKSTQMVLAFLETIKQGKDSIMFGSGYVIISQKRYDRLIEKRKEVSAVMKKPIPKPKPKPAKKAAPKPKPKKK